MNLENEIDKRLYEKHYHCGEQIKEAVDLRDAYDVTLEIAKEYADYNREETRQRTIKLLDEFIQYLNDNEVKLIITDENRLSRFIRELIKTFNIKKIIDRFNLTRIIDKIEADEIYFIEGFLDKKADEDN